MEKKEKKTPKSQLSMENAVRKPQVAKAPSMRAQVLDKAKTCVCGGRDIDYGTPENSFATIANLWNAYLAARGCKDTVTPHDVSIMMGLLKVARIAGSVGPYANLDSYVDLAGYAACAAELILEEEHRVRQQADKGGEAA